MEERDPIFVSSAMRWHGASRPFAASTRPAGDRGRARWWAAVMLDPGNVPSGLDDSKKLSQARREALYDDIIAAARVGVGIADVARIDRDNILAATLWAMGEAFTQLDEVSLALIDGNRAPRLCCAVQTIVGGDGRSLSIAAASIIAKVTRDRMMLALDAEHPRYGFARHKGYGTEAHRQALLRHGPTRHHRRSFAPIAALLAR